MWSDMKVYGFRFPADFQYAAFNSWDASRGFRGMVSEVTKRCPEDVCADASYRAADRILQKARKMGLCSFENGKWKKT